MEQREKHRQHVAKWRAANREKAREQSNRATKKSNALHPEKPKERQERFHAIHPGVKAGYNRTWADKNPKRIKEFSWRNQGINITHEEYEAMLVQQAYCCAICGVHASDLTTPLCVDHDHETGKVRGLLCKKCNSGIGMLKDDPMVVEAALKYLRNW